MIVTLAALSVLLMGGGIAMAIAFLVGTRKPHKPAPPAFQGLWRGGSGRTAREQRTHQIVLIAGIVLGALTWLLTGWLVGGLIVGLAIPGIPWLFTASGAEKRAVAKLSALESWTRRMSDYVRNGIGLQAAIVATSRTAPPLIESEVRTLAARLQAGMDPAIALRAFADELNDYNSDEVIAPLIMQIADAGEGLHDALIDIAQALAEEITARSTVDSERASARYTVRFLTGATVLVMLFGALSPSYAAPYRTWVGQMILAILVGWYVILMLWIRSLSLPDRLPRLLKSAEVHHDA